MCVDVLAGEMRILLRTASEISTHVCVSLSLSGHTGEPGTPGEKGEQGEAGAPGQSVAVGIPGIPGKWPLTIHH